MKKKVLITGDRPTGKLHLGHYFGSFVITSYSIHYTKLYDASTTISKSTYTLGSYGTSLYLYDPTTKKEYELDYAAQNLIEVGNEEDRSIVWKDRTTGKGPN